MCEFCTQHGDGKVWYKNVSNYSQDLLSDLGRRGFIENFLRTTIRDGFETLGRIEALHGKKGRLPARIIRGIEDRAKVEHFGQVLPIEEIRGVVLKADTVVRMPCACRWTAEKREERCCYGIAFGAEPWYAHIDMSYFGKPPEAGLETLTPEEAVRQMEEKEEEGAVHTIWTMMTPFIGAVCNCTARECLAMRTLSGIGAETMARAEYVAVIDGELCTGCGLCEGRCQFSAIGRRRLRGRDVAGIEGDRCFGCGLCRSVCEPRAISLKPR